MGITTSTSSTHCPLREGADAKDRMTRVRIPTITEVLTDVGVGRLHRYRSARPRKATVVLGHGAGGGIDARDLQALAASLPGAGFEVVLVEQPWVVEGKKVAPAPARLDAAWLPLVAAVKSGRYPLIVGGRSAGARVACRNATHVGATAVLALAFPLHPPGSRKGLASMSYW